MIFLLPPSKELHIKRRSRTRTVPFRILTLAQFGELDAISRRNDGIDLYVQMTLGPLQKLLRVRSCKFREHLTWLERRGYIRNLDLRRNHADFNIRLPDDWNWG